MSDAKMFRNATGLKGKTVFVGRGMYEMRFDDPPEVVRQRFLEVLPSLGWQVYDTYPSGQLPPQGMTLIGPINQGRRYTLNTSGDKASMLV